MQRELTDREVWFLSRIHKVVYRPQNTCPCEVCKDVYENGLKIVDRFHALYLSESEFEYNADGIPMQYFDTRQEAIDFENANKQS